MTTSDSEDFESADEDIEQEVSSAKSKIKSELENPEVKNDKDHSSNISDTVKSVSCVTLEEQNAEKLDKKDKTKSSDLLLCTGKENPHAGIPKTEKEENVLTADLDNEMRESNSHEKSIIERVSNVVSEQKLVRCQRGKRPQRTKESKSGPMKLGVRVTSDSSKSSGDNSYEITSKQELTVSNESELSSRKMEEKTTSDPGVYASVLDKISTSSKTNIPLEKEKKSVSEQQQTQSSGWGFGKSLIGTGGWGNVGGWGSSLLSTATLSVSTLGSHVSQGINTVLETVEAGIGAPNPEELARKMKEESIKQPEDADSGKEEESKEDQYNEEEPDELEMEAWGDWNEDGHEDSSKAGTGLLNLVSGVTQVTGKVLSTGLDTLETIGKKTMEVLQEGDPGLKKKRALLLGDDDTVVLSQVLREAKEKAEAEELEAEEKEAMRKAHFETLFDDYQGLVHLEALEMLSKQSDLRLKSMLLKETGPALKGLHIRLAAVQEMCEISDANEDEDTSNLEEILPDALIKLKIEISADKLLQNCKSSRNQLEAMKSEVAEDGSFQIAPRIIHQEAIMALATLTANAIEFFHKATELLLVKEGKSREVKEEARVMVGITSVLTAEVNKIAADFSEFLSTNLNGETLSAADKEKIESYITNIFLEASNSSTYIQDAFQLMVPVLQLGAVA